jgi:hypothetical protein
LQLIIAIVGFVEQDVAAAIVSLLGAFFAGTRAQSVWRDTDGARVLALILLWSPGVRVVVVLCSRSCLQLEYVFENARRLPW